MQEMDEVEAMEDSVQPATGSKRRREVDDTDQVQRKGDQRWEEGKKVLPGDKALVSDLSLAHQGGGTPILQVGSGLSHHEQHIVVNRAGILRMIVKKSTGKEPANIRLWVEGSSRRYYPCVQDMVIGTVISKGGEDFRVDIRGPSPAVLSGLAFEGATRRSRPRFDMGAVVYCRVQHAYRDTEPQITCISSTDKKGWMTGQTTYGELKGGFLFEVSIGYANSLLHPDNHVVAALGRSVAYEIAVGANGRVWVKAENVEATILAVNVIRNAEFRDKAQAEAMIEALTKNMQQR